MFFEVLHWADVVNLVVVCQQTEAFSPLLRKYFLMRQSLGSILESESVSDVFDYWSAIALPHVAFIAFILTLSALCLHCVNIVSTLCQQCASPSPSIWPIFDIFSLVQDLGFLEFQDRNLLFDFHSPGEKMP